MRWIEALKIWNGKKGGAWCVPRKGTAEHAEVKAIMSSGKEEKIPKKVIPRVREEVKEAIVERKKESKREKVKGFLKRAIEKRRAKKLAEAEAKPKSLNKMMNESVSNLKLYLTVAEDDLTDAKFEKDEKEVARLEKEIKDIKEALDMKAKKDDKKKSVPTEDIDARIKKGYEPTVEDVKKVITEPKSFTELVSRYISNLENIATSRAGRAIDRPLETDEMWKRAHPREYLLWHTGNTHYLTEIETQLSDEGLAFFRRESKKFSKDVGKLTDKQEKNLTEKKNEFLSKLNTFGKHKQEPKNVMVMPTESKSKRTVASVEVELANKKKLVEMYKLQIDRQLKKPFEERDYTDVERAENELKRLRKEISVLKKTLLTLQK